MAFNLLQVPLFSTLSEVELNNIRDFCQQKDISKWEYLFHEWDEPQALYILTSWRLSVEKWPSKSEVAVLCSWALIGEMAFFGDEKSRTASIVAVEDSELIVLLAFSLVQLFWKYPDIQEKMQSMILLREEENRLKWF